MPMVSVPNLFEPKQYASPIRIIEYVVGKIFFLFLANNAYIFFIYCIYRRLYLTRSNGWLLDNEQYTDWAAMGLSAPNYEDRDRDLLASSESSSKPIPSEDAPLVGDSSATTNSSPMVPTPQSFFARIGFKLDSRESVFPSPFASFSSSKSVGMSLIASSKYGLSGKDSSSVDGKKSESLPLSFLMKKKLDRQYVESNGLAAVRVAGNGFVWLLNSSTRVCCHCLNSLICWLYSAS